MKLLLTIASLTTLGVGIWLGYLGLGEVIWPCVVACGILLFFAAADNRLKKFKLGKEGFEGELYQLVNKTKVTVEQLQELAVTLSEAVISLLYREGRFGGGYSEKSRKRIQEKCLEILRRLEVPSPELEHVMADAYRCTEFDYVEFCLGGSRGIPGLSREQQEELERLRDTGIDGEYPDPDTIEDFLRRCGKLTSEAQERIKDYRFYKEHRRHRRPEVWDNRFTNAVQNSFGSDR